MPRIEVSAALSAALKDYARSQNSALWVAARAVVAARYDPSDPSDRVWDILRETIGTLEGLVGRPD